MKHPPLSDNDLVVVWSSSKIHRASCRHAQSVMRRHRIGGGWGTMLAKTDKPCSVCRPAVNQ